MQNAPDPVAILKKRRLPGLVALNGRLEPVWLNSEAAALLGPTAGPSPNPVREQMRFLARQLLARPFDPAAVEAAVVVPAQGVEGPVHGLRAVFLMPASGEVPAAPLVLVHIDTVALEREVDFDAVRRRYGISRREQDVLRMLYFGKGNREIAELLFISEYTVKDHIKAIMGKMGAASRSEVLYKLTTAA
jgi:DNA-binding NarL/FixJ family response regulator